MNPIINFILFIFLQFVSLRLIYSGIKSIIKLNKMKETQTVYFGGYVIPTLVIIAGIGYTVWHILSY